MLNKLKGKDVSDHTGDVLLIDCFNLGVIIPREQAYGIMSSIVPDPRNPVYLQPATALSIWGRTLNNMLNVAGQSDSSSSSSHLGMFMIQSQRPLMTIHQRNISMSMENAIYFMKMVNAMTKQAKLVLGLRSIVLQNIELLKKLLGIFVEGREVEGFREILSIVRNELMPDLIRDVDIECKKSFVKILATTI